jgi:hypothetical protein
MNMKLYLVLIFILLIGVTACQKESTGGSPIPSIEFTSLTNDTVTAGNSDDSVGIAFKFKDGDADIGNDLSSEKPDIFLVSTKFPDTLKYNFPPIPDEFKDPAKGIEGNALVAIKAAILLLDSANVEETVHFDLFIKDKAGNVSNTISIPDITLKP